MLGDASQALPAATRQQAAKSRYPSRKRDGITMRPTSPARGREARLGERSEPSRSRVGIRAKSNRRDGS